MKLTTIKKHITFPYNIHLSATITKIILNIRFFYHYYEIQNSWLIGILKPVKVMFDLTLLIYELFKSNIIKRIYEFDIYKSYTKLIII